MTTPSFLVSIAFQPGTEPIKQKQYAYLIAGLLVSIGCLVYALYDIEFSELAEAFAQANYFSLPLMWLCLYLFFLLKGLRWKWLLKPIGDYPLRTVVPPMMIGFMGNNIYPAHLGDFIRVYVFSRQNKVPYVSILSGIVFERVLDIIALLGLTGTALFFLPDVNENVRKASLIFAAGTVIGLCFLYLYVFFTPAFLKFSRKLLFLAPVSFQDKVLNQLELAARGFHVLRDPKLLTLLLLNSFLQWGCNATTIYIALWGFGISVSPLAACLVLGVTAFGVMIPSSPGFFGVIQLCFVVSLVPLGISQTDAVAASFYYHICQYVPVTLSGFYYMFKVGLHMKDLENAAEVENEAATSD
ncbi:MAG: flippase-like domain-containing protein [Planctomycetaceae bacterium]|nr:flippase-like domain-containing protein [Planctomycetaceae bacterium]